MNLSGGVVLGSGPGSRLSQFRLRLALPFEACGYKATIREDKQGELPVIRCKVEDLGTMVSAEVTMPAEDLWSAKDPARVCELMRATLVRAVQTRNRVVRRTADCWARLKGRRDRRRKEAKT